MTNGSAAILADTNILIYSVDPRDAAKRNKAEWILTRLISDERLVVSTQCLEEFVSASTKRLPEYFSVKAACTLASDFARTCRVIELTPAIVLEGCRGAAEYGMSIWDAFYLGGRETLADPLRPH
jgi:predicted nucleic acid-binding protein